MERSVVKVATELPQRRLVSALIPETFAMPLYFFHVHDGLDMPDDTGTVCAGPVEARTQAVIASGALLRDLGGRFWHHADWQMHVTDEQGAAVCDLHFKGTTTAA